MSTNLREFIRALVVGGVIVAAIATAASAFTSCTLARTTISHAECIRHGDTIITITTTAKETWQGSKSTNQ